MLGCTKYKCKEVTSIFYILVSSSFTKREKYNLLSGLILTEIVKNKIKQHIQNQRAAKNTQNDIEQLIPIATQCLVMDRKMNFTPLIIVFCMLSGIQTE